jgi:hypothetical protein
MQSNIITLHQFFVDALPAENIPIKVPSKVCSKCFVEKPLGKFGKNNSKKDKLDIYCKCCKNAKQAIYRAENKEEINAKAAIYYAENKEERATYYAENKEEKSAYNIIYYAEHKEELLAKAARPEVMAISNARQKERRATDPLFKLTCTTRNLIAMAIKNGGYKKNTKTANILGCSFEEFQTHLESQFQPNMTWNNQGDWHIDHFFPVSMATNEAQALMLNSYVNLRPLWAEDNHFKSAKAPYTIDVDSGEINILLECDRDYILNNFEKLEAFLKEFNILELDNSQIPAIILDIT